MTTLNLHGVELTLTDDHALPQIRKVLPDYSENVGRLAAAIERKYPGRGFVDVGANIGDTAVIVRAQSSLPILCIEGSQIYFDLLKDNIRQLQDVEVECALVDAASGERPGRLSVSHGTASFRTGSDTGSVTHFDRLENILARHPRFQSAKILKLDTDGMDGRIILGALEWIATARPVVFWEHDLGRDSVAGGPALSIFRRLFEIGYRTAVIFDNKGDYIQSLSLDARQQLADLSDYLPGGVQEVYGYCDICAFHADDLDLCAQVRQIELESRLIRRRDEPWPLNEPLLRAILAGEFATHRAEVINSIQDAITSALEKLGQREWARREAELSETLANRTLELQSLRAQTEVERYRLQLQVADQEKRTWAKEAEIDRLQRLQHEIFAGRTPVVGNESELQKECARLRHQLDTSLALRVARSLHWLLGPIRNLIAPGGSSRGGQA